MSESKDEFYLSAGGGAHPIDLADGRIVTPGTKVKLTAKEQQEAHNKHYIENNILQLLEEEKKGGSK